MSAPPPARRGERLARSRRLGTAARRRDPVKVLEEQSKGRVQELVPIRYGRMLASPFAFFRGAAAIMNRVYRIAESALKE